jgi:hypothetical protein
MQDLLLSLKRDFKYFNLAFRHDIKPFASVTFLEDNLSFVHAQFAGQIGKGRTLVFCQP